MSAGSSRIKTGGEKMTELKFYIKSLNEYVYEIARKCNMSPDQFRKKLDKKVQLNTRDLAYLSEYTGLDPETLQSMWATEHIMQPIEPDNMDRFIMAAGPTEIIDKITQDVYDEYTSWCMIRNIQPETKSYLSRRISKRLGLKTKVVRRGYETVRIFTKNTELPTLPVKNVI